MVVLPVGKRLLLQQVGGDGGAAANAEYAKKVGAPLDLARRRWRVRFKSINAALKHPEFVQAPEDIVKVLYERIKGCDAAIKLAKSEEEVRLMWVPGAWDIYRLRAPCRRCRRPGGARRHTLCPQG